MSTCRHTSHTHPASALLLTGWVWGGWGPWGSVCSLIKAGFVSQLQVETICRCFLPASCPFFESVIGPTIPEEELRVVALLQKLPANHTLPLFLLQSPRAREVHQVSIWAAPSLPSSSASALCPKVIPAASPPSVTRILGGSQAPLGSSSTPVQAHPGVSSSRQLLWAGSPQTRPRPPKPGPWT